MIDTDVYPVAALAGGPDRMIDTALVTLVQAGRVRVARDGTLTALDQRSPDRVEAAVLKAVGGIGRTVHQVRPRARGDRRLDEVIEALVREGLLRPGWWGRPPRPSAAGRRRLRELRSSAPLSATAAVALHGRGQLADATLRAAIFDAPPPVIRTERVRGRAGRSRTSVRGSGAGFAGHTCSAGVADGGGHSGGSGSDGGAGCGGGGGCGGGSS